MRGRGFQSFFSGTALLFFLTAQTLGAGSAFAAEAVSGLIQSITPLGDGRYELTLQGDERRFLVVMDRTMIEKQTTASEVKPGEKVTLPGGARPQPGIQGIKGMKDPFAGMSPQMREQLGLPDMPELPNIPSVPEVPAVPDIPKIPSLPKTGGGAAGMRNLPGLAGMSGAAGGAMAPAPGGEGGAEAQGGESGGTKVEHTADELPPPEEMLGPKAPVLSSAEGESPVEALAQPVQAAAVKTVSEARVTEAGVEISFEGEAEPTVLAADAVLIKNIDVSELQESMSITLNAEDVNGEMIVQTIQVA